MYQMIRFPMLIMKKSIGKNVTHRCSAATEAL
jgi:hypothetical protein